LSRLFSAYVDVVVYAREAKRNSKDDKERKSGVSYFYHGRAYDIVDITLNKARLEVREFILFSSIM